MVKDSYFLYSKCFVKYQQFFLLQGLKSLKGGKLSEGKFLLVFIQVVLILLQILLWLWKPQTSKPFTVFSNSKRKNPFPKFQAKVIVFN